MSHYSTCRTEIRDKDALKSALEDMGFSESDIKTYSKPVALYGFQGDRRSQKAEIVIPGKGHPSGKNAVGGASNDIGFVKREDGTYEAIISDYDRKSGMSRKNNLTKKTSGYNEKWLNLLTQRYSFHTIKKQADEMGYELEEEWEGDTLRARVSIPDY